MRFIFALSIVSLSGVFSLRSPAQYLIPSETRPLIASHRGDCGQFPEHTRAAYASAHLAGTDFNEIDLQVTKDNRLVIFHHPVLKHTSNIEDHPEFTSRMRESVFLETTHDNFTQDWLINDFTWAEIKTLKAKSRLPNRTKYLDNIFDHMLLEEVIEF